MVYSPVIVFCLFVSLLAVKLKRLFVNFDEIVYRVHCVASKNWLDFCSLHYIRIGITIAATLMEVLTDHVTSEQVNVKIAFSIHSQQKPDF